MTPWAPWTYENSMISYPGSLFSGTTGTLTEVLRFYEALDWI